MTRCDAPRAAGFDTTRRYVRVTGERPDGLVEFEFAIGEPELSVELILERAAFDEFCAAQHAQLLPPRTRAGDDDWDWRPSDATRTRFK